MNKSALICLLIGLLPDNLIAQIENITDIEGNTYKTVQIGAQTWMSENIKTTRYNDDSSIPLVLDNSEWTNLTTPDYC